MKKRWLLFIVLLVLLLTPIMLVLVLPGSWLVKPLEISASALSGRAVSIGGLDLDLLSRKPAATLVHVSVEDDAGGPLVSVATATIVIDAGKLLEGDVIFDRVDIDKITLQLRTDADGTTNWQNLISADDPSEASTRDETASLPAIAVLALNDFEINYQDAR